MAGTAANKGRKSAKEKGEEVLAAKESDAVVSSRSAKALQAAQMPKAPPPHSHGTRASQRSSAEASTPVPPTSGPLEDILARSKAKAMSNTASRKGRNKGAGGKKGTSRSGEKSAEEPGVAHVDEQEAESEAEHEAEPFNLLPEELQDGLDTEGGELAEELEASVHGVGSSLKMSTSAAPPPPTLPSHSDALAAPKMGSLVSVTLVVESQNEGTNGPILSEIPPMTLQVMLPVVGLEDGDPMAPIFSAKCDDSSRSKTTYHQNYQLP
ncbi:hypothetical protein P7C70_g8723, partial [Phenoliferia sp. Uapishka_3]